MNNSLVRLMIDSVFNDSYLSFEYKIVDILLENNLVVILFGNSKVGFANLEIDFERFFYLDKDDLLHAFEEEARKSIKNF